MQVETSIAWLDLRKTLTGEGDFQDGIFIQISLQELFSLNALIGKTVHLVYIFHTSKSLKDVGNTGKTREGVPGT